MTEDDKDVPERYSIYGGTIYTCWDCGALVGEEGMAEHDSYHDWLVANFGY